ncbi:hypothetical protein [Chromobacterium haemolyticum]|uniref:hypothetical protein n=1 Tax=Chromobacterium haemolyticum TaxID=394935 RepID=UPI000D2F4F0E|nr:hypothetical protein [Chromobacterium haemolyticum]PTU71455.1 hypothetical protein DBB33_19370 [Chromobacterium haemolyticum]
MADLIVKCARCRYPHRETERISRPTELGDVLACPRCGAHSYYDMTPQVAWCWASGLIEWGDQGQEPEGGIVIARGPKCSLKSILNVVARHGFQHGVLLVPGVPEAADQRAASDALDQWLSWCASTSHEDVVFVTPPEKALGGAAA